MNKALILVLALSSGVALGQSGLPSNGVLIAINNAGSTGTTLNTLTKLTGAPSTAVIAAISDTSGVIGNTIAGAGTTGTALIQTDGLSLLQFDGATTAGHYVQISSSTGGYGHDTGSATCPTSGQVIGRVLTTNGSGGLYQVRLGPNGCGAAVTSGVSSFTGDGALLSNSASTSAVTATLANAGAHKYWGNNTGSPTTPAYVSIATADLPGTGATIVNSQTCTLGSTCTVSLVNALTMNSSGSGVASGTTFDGSTARVLSYNTLGAAPAANPTITGSMTLGFLGSVLQCLYADASNVVHGTGSACGAGGGGGGFSGPVFYTSSHPLSSSDNGSLVVMNCSSACSVTLPNPQPANPFIVSIVSIGGTTATVALGASMTYNGSSSVPVLLPFSFMSVVVDSGTITNYIGSAPFAAGSNVTITSTSNAQTVASSTTGFSGTKVAGSCTLTISNGLITNVTGC